MLLLTPLSIVARIQSAEPVEKARATAERELTVTRHLAFRGLPVLRPLEVALAGPHVLDGCVVSFWPYIDHAPLRRQADMIAAARGLRAIHEALMDFGGTLPPYQASVDQCWTVLIGMPRAAFPATTDKEFLTENFLALRHQLEALGTAARVLHGDAHKGNVLVGAHGPVWIDFESVCRGPLEFELATLPRYAHRHVGKADTRLVDLFTDLKSVCVAVWCLADAGRSAEMRDAARYHLQRLRQQ
ncbi:phosphotransferase family enzyme [Nitrospirillum amazonense]|uniref:Phosphotransferase family enzyme n=1 Tax=Nitrospirillum amazonense TaxID=28077 RepID=A0A560JG16_9PROT|nr:aminoglycoside phosphotransferase family protein [Nitrospirillum amazonense]TWB69907.1 phosphotransferase family enzyme [Nitrospirillum amazonense]